jgi:antitoxin CcdA
MQQIYDTHAQKKATNLSLNSDLLSKAKALKINLSATLEKSLAEEVRKRKAETWLAENKEAIEASNKFIEKNGLFSDGLRQF